MPACSPWTWARASSAPRPPWRRWWGSCSSFFWQKSWNAEGTEGHRRHREKRKSGKQPASPWQFSVSSVDFCVLCVPSFNSRTSGRPGCRPHPRSGSPGRPERPGRPPGPRGAPGCPPARGRSRRRGYGSGRGRCSSPGSCAPGSGAGRLGAPETRSGRGAHPSPWARVRPPDGARGAWPSRCH